VPGPVSLSAGGAQASESLSRRVSLPLPRTLKLPLITMMIMITTVECRGPGQARSDIGSFRVYRISTVTEYHDIRGRCQCSVTPSEPEYRDRDGQNRRRQQLPTDGPVPSAPSWRRRESL
jgi:hypothetical protein